MPPLQDALVAASPRLTPRPPQLAGTIIHGGVLGLWIVLVARAFCPHGLFAWGAGVCYVCYDTVLLLFVAGLTLSLRHARAPHPPQAGARPSLGVIVAAHNEAAVLEVTLQSLFDQTDPPDMIVLADDGSTDGSAEVMARRYGLSAPALGELSPPSPARPTLRWLRLPHGGKANALNAAIIRIETEVVMTVDADTLLAPDAIAAMRDAFAVETELVAATGVLAPVCVTTLSGRVLQWFQTYEYIRNFMSRFAWMRADSLLLVSGAFAGFRREAVLTVGGFDGACLVEDYELIHRLHRYAVERGVSWRVRVLGTARARTEAPGTLGAFLRQRRRWFAGFLQTQYWNRDMTGNSRFGRLGTLMLPVKAIDTLQPIYGLAAFALLVFFLATGRFAILLPVSAVIGGKLVLDLAYHLWSVHLYRRWTGERAGTHFGYALIAALAEPFSFQLLRHLGAAWGWIAFLSGRQTWMHQRRFGVLPRVGQQKV